MDALEERIKRLRQRYALTLPRFVAEMTRLMQTDDGKVPRGDLLGLLHTLAGTAGTFGFQEIATMAREAECIVSSNPEPEITIAELGPLTARLAGLEAALSRHLETVDESTDTAWATFEGGGVV